MRAPESPSARQRYRSMLALGITALAGSLAAPALLGRPMYSLVVLAAWGFFRAWYWRGQLALRSVEQDARQHVGEDTL